MCHLSVSVCVYLSVCLVIYLFILLVPCLGLLHPWNLVWTRHWLQKNIWWKKTWNLLYLIYFGEASVWNRIYWRDGIADMCVHTCVRCFIDVMVSTFCHAFKSQSWHCLVISEIDDCLWQVNYLGIYTPPRSTQPCIFLWSLNRVPASAGVEAGKSPLPGAGNTVWSHMACDFP